MRPKPSRVSAFRNCFGTIWSVSTLTRSSGATIPVCVVNGCILQSSVLPNRCAPVEVPNNDAPESNARPTVNIASLHVRHVKLADVDEVAGDGGGRCHDRADQVRAA